MSANDDQTTLIGGKPSVTAAPLAASGVDVGATAGAPFEGTIATFNNADPLVGADSYTALIAWGDGSTSAGVISGTRTLVVAGSHTYASPMTEAGDVVIGDSLGDTTRATVPVTVVSLDKEVEPDMTASVGFWHHRNGQSLIKSFNGGSTATVLSAWLASTFPNLYGIGAGPNDLRGRCNAQMATFYQEQFAPFGSNLNTNVLATALSLFATTSSLGGNAGIAYNFAVSSAGLGARSVNVKDRGAAFDVANESTCNVYQLLKAVDAQTVTGMLYNGDPALQDKANDLFAELLD